MGDLRRLPQLLLGLAAIAAVLATTTMTVGAQEPVDAEVGDLVITEVMQNPSAVSDSAGEWFEIHNRSEKLLSLQGFMVADDDTDSMTIERPVSIPPGGYVVLGNNADIATNGGVNVDYQYSDWFLANGADEIVLIDPSGGEVDRIDYDGGPNWPDPNGASMQLDPGAMTIEANDDPANWCEATTSFGGDRGTPGDENHPCDGGGGNEPMALLISEIQGTSDSTPFEDQAVTISGIVVGDFQEIVTDDAGDEPLDGFFVQEEDFDADGNPATSDGIFVYAPGGPAVAVGDHVEVTGTVIEFYGLTEIAFPDDVAVLSSDNPLPTPATPVLPTSLSDAKVDWEAIEGMRVTFDQPLYVTGMFRLGSLGEVQLSAFGAQDHPNQLFAPGSSAALELRELNRISRVILDDGEDESESFPGGIATWNPTPTPYLGGPDNTLRTGDAVQALSGVVHFAWGEYEVHPINLADPTNPTGAVQILRTPRPTTAPAVGASLQVAAFNVLNYFVTIDTGGATCGPLSEGCRGADTADEFATQVSKIATAIAKLDADIVGLVELQNSANDEAIADLVDRVNAMSSRTYAYVPTGYIGTDVITGGFIYDTATVATVGDHAILDNSVSPAFVDTKNRPVLAQTFEQLSNGATLTAAVSHLKSKGSSCADVANPGDPAYGVAAYRAGADADVGPLGDPDYTGNCNLTRTAAAQVLGGWLASDPTETGATNTIVLGDLNAYANETPISALQALGYTNLAEVFAGLSWDMGGHSYVFDGELGTLDYAMANPALLPQVTGATTWNINADEPFAIDYQNYNPAGQANPNDEFKSSDHDPIVVGLDLADPPVTCGGLQATMIGSDAADVLVGTADADVIAALGGDDKVIGLGGDDTICLGDGDDRAMAGAGDDVVYGGEGTDAIIGGRGADELFGEAGPDYLAGNHGDDLLDGGGDDDRGHGGAGHDACAVEQAKSCES